MAAPTTTEINAVIDAKNKAEKDTAKVAAVKLDAQQITGTRYKARFSEATSD